MNRYGLRGLGFGHECFQVLHALGCQVDRDALAADLNLASGTGTLTVSNPLTSSDNAVSVIVIDDTFALTANNSYSGGTSIIAGTLSVSVAGATAGAGTVAVGTNTLDIANGASVINVLKVTNGATVTSSTGGGTLASAGAHKLGSCVGLNRGDLALHAVSYCLREKTL